MELRFTGSVVGFGIVDVEFSSESLFKVLIFNLEELVDVGIFVDEKGFLEVSAHLKASVACNYEHHCVGEERASFPLERSQFLTHHVIEPAFTI